MSKPTATAVSWLAARLSTALILALLVCVGIVGARNDWKIGSLHTLWAGGGRDEDPPAPAIKIITESVDRTSHASGSELPLNARLEFPSAEAVAQAGIRVVPTQVRAITQSVT